MQPERFRVKLTREAKEMLRRVGKKYGRKTYEVLRNVIRELEFEPENKGQPLRTPLHGLYALHYSRFRIIYRIEQDQAIVIVVAAGYHESGARRDIYEVIERLVEAGHLEVKKPDDEA